MRTICTGPSLSLLFAGLLACCISAGAQTQSPTHSSATARHHVVHHVTPACPPAALPPVTPAGLPPASGAVQTAFALRYVDVVQGSGAPAQPGEFLTVQYTGWLAATGSKFDSSLDRNEPFTFVQGERQVIPGWDQGFEGMRVGGKRRLFIPWQLAYGADGRGPIPAKADLIFDIELLAAGTTPPAPPTPPSPPQPAAPPPAGAAPQL